MASQHEPVVPSGSETMYRDWHLAPATRMGDQVVCSGVIGTRADGTVPEDLAEEIEVAFANLADVLAAAGSGLDQVADLLTYHLDMPSQVPTFMQVRDRTLGEPWPSWTAIGVSQIGGGMPGVRIEIRATAYSPRTV